MSTIDARMILKRSQTSGATPTIGPTNNHRDGTWTTTNVYPSELFNNTVDDRLWLGENELPMLIGTGQTSSSIPFKFAPDTGSTFSIQPTNGSNTITTSDYSSILGGQNNIISGLTNTHIIGSNITALSGNTTYVNELNINDITTGVTNEIVGILSDGTIIKNPKLTMADDDADAGLSGVTKGQFYQLSGNGGGAFSGLLGVVIVKH